MKQHISETDIQQLSDKGKERLREWLGKCDTMFVDSKQDLIFTEKGLLVFNSQLPLLSIGQMIEFLDEHVENLDIRGRRMNKSFLIDVPDNTMTWDIWGGEWSSIEDEPVLCDALWEATKKILEKE